MGASASTHEPEDQKQAFIGLCFSWCLAIAVEPLLIRLSQTVHRSLHEAMMHQTSAGE